MNRDEFNALLSSEFEELFNAARLSDELAFLFSILGINSGIEDAGWQPIAETRALVHDLVGLINGPLHDEARVRMGLFLYCHITEASYLYHVIYNMLLTIGREPPKVFSFLDKYKNGVPPSVATKIAEIKKTANSQGHPKVCDILDEVTRTDIRNAFFHSDYVLFNSEMRLKHRGSQIKKIPFSEVLQLVEKTVDFFSHIMNSLTTARKSFPKGYEIIGRKSLKGQNLCSVKVIVDDNGYAVGFETSDPLPIW